MTYEGKKNLGPRTLWREGGGASRFIRHVEVEDQDKITPGDPARSENTTLRDAAGETSKQDRKRPDIPLLEAEGRGTPETLARAEARRWEPSRVADPFERLFRELARILYNT